jgi:hypothetical protein
MGQRISSKEIQEKSNINLNSILKIQKIYRTHLHNKCKKLKDDYILLSSSNEDSDSNSQTELFRTSSEEELEERIKNSNILEKKEFLEKKELFEKVLKKSYVKNKLRSRKAARVGQGVPADFESDSSESSQYSNDFEQDSDDIEGPPSKLNNYTNKRIR